MGACEEDAETRAGLASSGVTITHERYAGLLSSVECDVVVCGDFFGIRGERLLQAMECGRHVLCDKPICTSMGEFRRIASLSAERGLKVGCMLDLIDAGPFRTLRNLIRGNRIGEVHTVAFLGQHPLLYGKRPAWNFEPGKHGGSLNDIAVHAIDAIPWLTGRAIVEVTAARAWNAKIRQHPGFQDGAMLLLRLDNNGGVLGDVSYLSSDRHGYQMAPYWRFTLSGTDGVAETGYNEKTVHLWRHDSDAAIEEPVEEPRIGGYFEDFLLDVAGTLAEDGLNTERVLRSTRIALAAQQAADEGTFGVAV